MVMCTHVALAAVISYTHTHTHTYAHTHTYIHIQMQAKTRESNGWKVAEHGISSRPSKATDKGVSPTPVSSERWQCDVAQPTCIRPPLFMVTSYIQQPLIIPVRLRADTKSEWLSSCSPRRHICGCPGKCMIKAHRTQMDTQAFGRT